MKLIDGDRLADSIHRALCGHITCNNCPFRTEDGGCGVEVWLDSAPVVEPKQEWIPCSERLPEDSGAYLVRFSDDYIEDHSSLDLAEIEIERFDADCESFGYWVDRFDPVSLGFVDSDWVELPIIALMPLPPAYEGE